MAAAQRSGGEGRRGSRGRENGGDFGLSHGPGPKRRLLVSEFEKGKMFDDSGEGAALLQILRLGRLQKPIYPVVAMLHHVVAEHGGDLLEALLCLLARLGGRAIVC